MQHLILRPGPQLVMRKLRPEPDDLDARPNEIDVTDRAHEFLFELPSLHAGQRWPRSSVRRAFGDARRADKT
jgi:hypothetical protein